jgi:16S rRNA (guanine527-N7)-methyltransferase
MRNGLDIGDDRIELMELYIRLLLDWNKSINLISRKDEENVWKHILGSISFLFRFKLPAGKILDLGTGGGLPGIPLAILHPQSEFTLVDSIQKKIKALSSIVTAMKLPNAITICGRGEELTRNPAYRHRFDFVVSRGVSEIRNVIAWSRDFLKAPHAESGKARSGERPLLPVGSILMLKGGDLLLEIETARVKFNPRDIDVIPLVFDGGDPVDFHDKKLIIIRP